MNWMPTLAAWPFAAAGITAAAATLLVHLLNRRRPRTIEWGAMDFLRAAIKKNQRTIRLRDAILIVLRCAAALIFGLALARPHFAGYHDSSSAQPVHLILVIDNSLSMAYETLEGTLLARAKESATRAIEHLPPGSICSVIAAASTSQQRQTLPADPAESVVAVERLRVVDLPLDLEAALSHVESADKLSGDLPTRIVFFSDMQDGSWKVADQTAGLASVASFQLVDVSSTARDNTAILEIDVVGGFAIASQPATISATIGRSGGQVNRDAEVSLAIDDVVVASKAIQLPAGDVKRRLTFQHRFEAGLATSAVASVSITADRLPLDDVRHAVVPVFPVWPLLCVDQLSNDEEDPARGAVGETRPLRKLLAAGSSSDSTDMSLHIAFEELRSEHCSATRAIVIGGVRDPASMLSVLREFVEAGGQLLIAAGGEFDPAVWNANGWLGGRGILPVPLADALQGQTPSESQGSLSPWMFEPDSLLTNNVFRLQDNSQAELTSLYAEPLVFKIVGTDAASESGPATVLARLRSAVSDEGEDAMDEHPPILVERKVGAGRVLFFASSLRPTWNTLSNTSGVVMLDAIARDMIAATLPIQNVTASDRIEVSLPIDQRRAKVSLTRPDRPDIEVLAINDQQISINDVGKRGIYRVTASSEGSSDVLELPVAINGPPIESDLTRVDEEVIARLAMNRNVSMTNSVDGVSVRDLFEPRHSLAWWMVAVVLLLLCAESAVLIAARMASRQPTRATTVNPTLRPEAGQVAR